MIRAPPEPSSSTTERHVVTGDRWSDRVLACGRQQPPAVTSEETTATRQCEHLRISATLRLAPENHRKTVRQRSVCGYSLAAGSELTPLLLDDDEAVAIAVALHRIAHRSSTSIADGASGALTKLSQVMPTSLRDRVAALSSVVVEIGSASNH